jgi:hypothetical protein
MKIYQFHHPFSLENGGDGSQETATLKNIAR